MIPGMAFALRDADLTALNSLTKYPSIPTYHTLDPANGGLLDETVPFTGTVIGTEKVDGTNSRIISLPDGNYLLGSREELLYAKGDLIGNPAQGIVAALREFADALAPVTDDVIRVHYVETYGGKVTAASKQYTGSRAVGFRLFDVAVLSDHATLLALPAQQISTWRETGGQQYRVRKGPDHDRRTRRPHPHPSPVQHRRHRTTGRPGQDPRLPRRTPAPHPQRARRWRGRRGRGHRAAHADRTTIAKARFQDYDRTLRRRR